MRTWDFFDTLAGRACGEPWRVFELMGGEEFKKLRQAAEQKSDKTFNGIYSSLKALTGWSSERANELQQQEYELERKLVFPIRQNVVAVAPKDEIITDTYFDVRHIQELGEIIGLPKNLKIHASYGGKWSGSIWKEFRANRRHISRHTGDNKRSDYEMARLYGVSAALYSSGGFTEFENELSRAGHWDVAGLARCVRLQNPYAVADSRFAAWNKQAAYNIPFLFLCAAAVQQYARANGFRFVYFLTRDAGLLQRVFAALYPETPCDTFYASRQTYLSPSPSFLKYAQAAASKDGVLFVDLQGTGKSVFKFSQKFNIVMPYLFCAVPLSLPIYTPALFGISKIGTELEVFNYDTQGRVLDVVNDLPVRDKVEYSLDFVHAAHAAVDCALKYFFKRPSPPTDEIMRKVLTQSRHAPKQLVRQHVIEHSFSSRQRNDGVA